MLLSQHEMVYLELHKWSTNYISLDPDYESQIILSRAPYVLYFALPISLRPVWYFREV